MVKKTQEVKTKKLIGGTWVFTEEYVFQGEKKTCWRYDSKDSVVNGSVFLKKKKWPEKPGTKLKITYQIEGDTPNV